MCLLPSSGLQKQAESPSRSRSLVSEGNSSSRMEDFLNAFPRLGRTFHVPSGVDRLGQLRTLSGADELRFWLLTLTFSRPKVSLRADKEERGSGTEVTHLWNPFLEDIFVAVVVVYGEAEDKDISVWVRERSQ